MGWQLTSAAARLCKGQETRVTLRGRRRAFSSEWHEEVTLRTKPGREPEPELGLNQFPPPILQCRQVLTVAQPVDHPPGVPERAGLDAACGELGALSRNWTTSGGPSECLRRGGWTQRPCTKGAALSSQSRGPHGPCLSFPLQSLRP